MTITCDTSLGDILDHTKATTIGDDLKSVIGPKLSGRSSALSQSGLGPQQLIEGETYIYTKSQEIAHDYDLLSARLTSEVNKITAVAVEKEREELGLLYTAVDNKIEELAGLLISTNQEWEYQLTLCETEEDIERTNIYYTELVRGISRTKSFYEQKLGDVAARQSALPGDGSTSTEGIPNPEENAAGESAGEMVQVGAYTLFKPNDPNCDGMYFHSEESYLDYARMRDIYEAVKTGDPITVTYYSPSTGQDETVTLTFANTNVGPIPSESMVNDPDGQAYYVYEGLDINFDGYNIVTSNTDPTGELETLAQVLAIATLVN